MLTFNLDGLTDWDEPTRHIKGYFYMSAYIRKSFFKNRLVCSLQANDITRSIRERWTFYGTNVIS